MMVTFFLGFLSDDLLRSLDRLRTDGQSFRRRGSSCGIRRSTWVLVRELARTEVLGESVGVVGGDLGDPDIDVVSFCCCCCCSISAISLVVVCC